MKLTGPFRLAATAVALGLLIAASGVAVANAKSASRTLTTEGGSATITKAWRLTSSKRTFAVSWRGTLTDIKGDQRHVKLIRHDRQCSAFNANPTRRCRFGHWGRDIVKGASFGRRVKFNGGVFSDRVTFEVCTYVANPIPIDCSGEW